MPRVEKTKKGVALFIVLATVLIVIILGGIILRITLTHSRLTHHQVSRIKAYYAGRAIMNYTLEMLRKGTNGGWVPSPPSGAIKFACYRHCIDVETGTYNILPINNTDVDPDIPYDIQVKIYPMNSAGTGKTQIDVTTEYSYK